jgi:membrane protease YdiL (CAAX protease family)
MLKLSLMILVLFAIYVLLFKLLPIIGIIPFLLRGLNPADITGLRFFILTILYVPLALLAIHGAMMLRGYGLNRLIIRVKLSDFYIGITAGILIAFLNLSIDLWLKHILREDFSSTLRQIGGSAQGLIAMIGAAWLAGGILEEVFWRGFWFSEWRAALGGSFLSLLFCVLISSIFFGLTHLQQGLSGVVSSSVSGLCFGLLYLLRDNLIAPIIAHGTVDTLLLPAIWYWFGKT